MEQPLLTFKLLGQSWLSVIQNYKRCTILVILNTIDVNVYLYNLKLLR